MMLHTVSCIYMVSWSLGMLQNINLAAHSAVVKPRIIASEKALLDAAKAFKLNRKNKVSEVVHSKKNWNLNCHLDFKASDITQRSLKLEDVLQHDNSLANSCTISSYCWMMKYDHTYRDPSMNGKDILIQTSRSWAQQKYWTKNVMLLHLSRLTHWYSFYWKGITWQEKTASFCPALNQLPFAQIEQNISSFPP